MDLESPQLVDSEFWGLEEISDFDSDALVEADHEATTTVALVVASSINYVFSVNELDG